jgi:hypothetical protein
VRGRQRRQLDDDRAKATDLRHPTADLVGT